MSHQKESFEPYVPAFSAEHVRRLYASINYFSYQPYLSEVLPQEFEDPESDLTNEVLGVVALYAVAHSWDSTRDYQVDRLLAYLENDGNALDNQYNLPPKQRSTMKTEVAIKVAHELDKTAGLRK